MLGLEFGIAITDYSREETSQCPAEQDNVISRIDGSRKGGFVGIQVGKNMCEDGRRFLRGGGSWRL
jgi:hypothetical protein